MSSVLRTAARSAVRTRQGVRGYSQAHGGDYFAQREAVRAHADSTTQLWRRISFYVCFPVTAVVIAWVRNAEAEHAEHLAHLKEENGGKLPEVPNYDYLNKRVKPYPWGMNSLFFNPHVNKDLSASE
ncbi:mitochondrial cytochrome c oxidase subunit VIa [Coniophora puteana RWD-64-598 SS2]|uniref:Mitochondrial cytochrome c oxidase subunit VIa n=1 Tax=Coniophora puteana (strain RWD-64-598) TaxID=741705 RepID=A0A5M3N7K3_CONPW|nr:mitochondrial cytochrome c oxidase subunit VIa [Coniophora puteana RWD-64-598 SS2]EIW86815.1 mitochondrial cytochrome c oxidase subunit VIa [Coniophora puteana RWD-64-598 SS2]